MARWPTRVKSVTKPQEAILRKLARHLTDEGMPLASQPQFFLGTHDRTLQTLASYLLVEQVGPPVWSVDPNTLRQWRKYMPWALTWRGRGYLRSLDKQRRGEPL